MMELNDCNDDVVDMTCNGECSRCGECCGLYIPFNDTDIDIIKQYVKEHNIQPQKRLVITEDGETFEARCCFYDKDNKCCTIYPVRPFVCRDFICSRKNWRKYRDLYEDMGQYNSSTHKSSVATFDDKIFNDFSPIILSLANLCVSSDGSIDGDKFCALLKAVNRLDVLEHFKATDINGNVIEGTDLLEGIRDDI